MSAAALWSGWDGNAARSRSSNILGPTLSMPLVWNVSNPSAIGGSNLAISVDGEIVLTISANSSNLMPTLFAYNVTNGHLLYALPYPTTLYNSSAKQLLIDALPDFHAVAVFNCSIVVTSSNGSLLWQWHVCHDTRLIDAQIAPSTNTIIAITANTSIWWLDVVDGSILSVTSGGTNVTAALSLSNDRFVINEPGKSVITFNISNGVYIWGGREMYLRPLQSSIYSDDGQLLFVSNGASLLTR